MHLTPVTPSGSGLTAALNTICCGRGSQVHRPTYLINGSINHPKRDMRFFLFVFGLSVALTHAVAGTEGEVSAAQLAAVLKHGQLIKETENKFQCDMEKPK